MNRYRCPVCRSLTLPTNNPWTDDASGMLPDDDITVLVALDDGEVWPAYYDSSPIMTTKSCPVDPIGWRYVTGERIESSRVVYWMPMPQHPDHAEEAA